MQSIATKIGVSFRKLDKKEFFHNKVVIPFIEGLESGETPNPCMRCNPTVKFTLLREIASVENAQYIATGHYARVTYKDEEGYILLKGVDRTKDQSYVLAYLDQETLSKLILPLGTAYKKDILSIANELKYQNFYI